MLKLIKATFFFICLTFLSRGYATTTTEVFQNHPNPIFIETGSFQGDGIQKALEAGFQTIYSIELAPHYYDFCKTRFQEQSRVHLFQGDSSVILEEVLKTVHEKATFWLDGHYSAGVNSGRGAKQCPILEELLAIARHPIKNHTILIDDVRLFGTMHFDYVELDEVITFLRKINPHYNIYFENGVIENDVLVAELHD